jgi:hypothetical protein
VKVGRRKSGKAEKIEKREKKGKQEPAYRKAEREIVTSVTQNKR